MADSDLPVFSFRANWREPMSEKLGFLTNVLRASEGAEQRRILRDTPRRTYQGDFLLVGPERTFWDLFINKLGGGEVVAPLYWETVTLSSALSAGVSDRIDFDTTYREWTYHVGYLAILMGKTAMDYEVVEIAAVDAGGVDLAATVGRTWPVGTKLLPLRRAVLEQVGTLDHETAGVANVTAELRVIGPNPWTPAADSSPTYTSLPVFLQEPNWVDSLGVQMTRDIDMLDAEVGLTYQVDATGRVLSGQAHRWFLPGRENLAEFRDLVYRHKGRAGSFWLPTFKADFRLVNSPGSGATQIEVENVGYLYTGGPTSGREYIAIKHSGGTILRKVTSVVPGATSATEKLNLDAALGLALSPGLVHRISFVDVARFDTDDFEITHFGGIDGHHEVSARMRTFKNTRTSPLPIHYPQVAGVENADPCGVPAGSTPIFAYMFFWDPSHNVGKTLALAQATGIIKTGFAPSDVVRISLPDHPTNSTTGGDRGGAYRHPGETTSWWSRLWVFRDSNPADYEVLGSAISHATAYDAWQDFGEPTITGGSTYTFAIVMENHPDRTATIRGGMQIRVDVMV